MQKGNKNLGVFPNPLAPKSEKAQESFGLKVAQGIEGEWFSNQKFNFTKRQAQIQEWRSYAYGKQNVDRYKQRINPSGDNSYYNLDFSPIPIIPKFVKTVLFSIFDNSFDIEVKAIDPMALSEREAYKNDLVGKIMNKDFIDQMKEEYGVDMLQGQELPESLEEVDIHMNLNFKQSVEIAAEIAIRYAFKLNDYDDQTKMQVIEDIITCGFGIVKDKTDAVDGIQIPYVDPEYFVHSASRKKDFTDVFYMGHIDFMPIAELRRQAKIYGAEWADNFKVLDEIAQMYSGEYGNPAFSTVDRSYINSLGYYPYDSFLIPVLKFEWKASDAETYESKENAFGNKTFKKKPEGYKPPKKSKYKREQYEDKYEEIYQGCYILKTKYIYGWGRQENQARPNDNLKKACWSYTLYAPEYYKEDTSSLVAKMIPSADAIQLAYLRMQVALANAAPDGYAIDLSALDAVDLGNNALNPMVITDIHRATGNLFYRSQQEDYGRNAPPITPMPSVLQNISKYIEQIQFNLQFLREITGIVPELDGQTKRDQLVGVTEIAIEGSRNATGDITASIRNITRRLAEKVLTRIQDLPKGSPIYKEYVEAVGQANMAVVDSMDSIPIHKFGIDITVGKNDAERLMFERDVTAMVNAGMITPDERYFILNIPNVRYAAAYLKVTREKRERRKLQEDMAKINQQGQVNAQASQAKAQADAQSKQLQKQAELMFEQSKFQTVTAPEMRLQFEYDARLEMIKNKGKVDEKQVQAMANAAMESAKEDRKDERSKMEATQQSEIAFQRQENLPPKDFTETEGFTFQE